MQAHQSTSQVMIDEVGMRRGQSILIINKHVAATVAEMLSLSQDKLLDCFKRVFFQSYDKFNRQFLATAPLT